MHYVVAEIQRSDWWTDRVNSRFHPLGFRSWKHTVEIHAYQMFNNGLNDL
jgi:hypothetical protein